MKKTWTINNGWNRLNDYGQMVLRQIGPMDFDDNYEVHQQMIAEGSAKYVPYRSVGSSYVFARKSDFVAAVERLRERGYIA